MPKEIHAPGPTEHSLCGLAPEAYETGDHVEPVVFAEVGQRVSCETCRMYIRWSTENFKIFRNYRYEPSTVNKEH